MSNPNGISSMQDVRMCIFLTQVNEKGELEVAEKTVKVYKANEEEFIQLPVESYTINEKGARVSENGDIYEKNRNKIVVTKAPTGIVKHDNTKIKEDKRRA